MMYRPFNLTEVEARSLLAALDTIMETVDGSDEEMEEFDWLATRAAGKVMINHLRDKLENFIAKRNPKL